MADISKITDYYQRVVKTYILEQFKDSENINAILSLVSRQVDDLETATFELQFLYDVDNQEGVQLDMLGELLNVSRNDRTDVDYRIAIKASFGILNSGTPEDVCRSVKALTGSSYVEYVPEYPAAFWTLFDGSGMTQSQLDSLAPAGVRGWMGDYWASADDGYTPITRSDNGDTILVAGKGYAADAFVFEILAGNMVGAQFPFVTIRNISGYATVTYTFQGEEITASFQDSISLSMDPYATTIFQIRGGQFNHQNTLPDASRPFVSATNSRAKLTRILNWGGFLKNKTSANCICYGHQYLTAIPITWKGWETVQEAFKAFYGCLTLSRIGYSWEYMEALEEMSSMFQNCYTLPTIPESWIGLGNVVYAVSTFENCYLLQGVPFSWVGLNSVQYVGSFLKSCYNLAGLPSTWEGLETVINMPFFIANTRDLEELPATFEGLNNVTYMASFAQGSQLRRLPADFTGLDSVEDVSYMYADMPVLVSTMKSWVGMPNVTRIAYIMQNSNTQAGGYFLPNTGMETLVNLDDCSFAFAGLYKLNMDSGDPDNDIYVTYQKLAAHSPTYHDACFQGDINALPGYNSIPSDWK